MKTGNNALEPTLPISIVQLLNSSTYPSMSSAWQCIILQRAGRTKSESPFLMAEIADTPSKHTPSTTTSPPSTPPLLATRRHWRTRSPLTIAICILSTKHHHMVCIFSKLAMRLMMMHRRTMSHSRKETRQRAKISRCSLLALTKTVARSRSQSKIT